MFEVNCPYCDSTEISDNCNDVYHSDGAWECGNGHQFLITLLWFKEGDEDVETLKRRKS